MHSQQRQNLSSAIPRGWLGIRKPFYHNSDHCSSIADHGYPSARFFKISCYPVCCALLENLRGAEITICLILFMVELSDTWDCKLHALIGVPVRVWVRRLIAVFYLSEIEYKTLSIF